MHCKDDVITRKQKSIVKQRKRGRNRTQKKNSHTNSHILMKATCLFYMLDKYFYCDNVSSS